MSYLCTMLTEKTTFRTDKLFKKRLEKAAKKSKRKVGDYIRISLEKAVEHDEHAKHLGI